MYVVVQHTTAIIYMCLDCVDKDNNVFDTNMMKWLFIAINGN